MFTVLFILKLHRVESIFQFSSMLKSNNLTFKYKRYRYVDFWNILQF